ncbi:EF-hand calcium-binding domain-containing protein 6 [Galemys pyrenaicus]|uniref:EF-hand calcium-binding domain-containing protein 6 n=1 Tax=Galemys pyrenaicus TaxID=202257 RepID=A0A8J6AAJ9_GALPY|nr:EF-hand calcium-binding domain-containing protein 6 [Galemys pyrenaicus]
MQHEVQSGSELQADPGEACPGRARQGPGSGLPEGGNLALSLRSGPAVPAAARGAVVRGLGCRGLVLRALAPCPPRMGCAISKHFKSVLRAFKLIDVNRTNLIQAHELRRVLESFCLKMKDDEYKKFAKRYSIDKDTAVDYNAFLKTLSTNNDSNLRHHTGNRASTNLVIKSTPKYVHWRDFLSLHLDPHKRPVSIGFPLYPFQISKDPSQEILGEGEGRLTNPPEKGACHSGWGEESPGAATECRLRVLLSWPEPRLLERGPGPQPPSPTPEPRVLLLGFLETPSMCLKRSRAARPGVL